MIHIIYTGSAKTVIRTNKRHLLSLKVKKLKNTINYYLNNWLFKPVCGDLTVSINPRLMKKLLKN